MYVTGDGNGKNKLKNENQIVAVGRGKYVRLPESAKKKPYVYPHSIEYKDIESKIMGAYPLADFQMWELIQFNERENYGIQYSGKPTGTV